MKAASLRVLVCALVLASVTTASAAPSGIEPNLGTWLRGLFVDLKPKPVTLAVIGDTPYGMAQVIDFPNFIADINADEDVVRVVHVGDIKNGSTRCDDSYFTFIDEQLATFEDPLVYTPGDNEWTDCHRSNNGKYDPLERLAALRDVFYAEPARTLGGEQRPLLTQAFMSGYQDIPENQLWTQARVLLATLHVVGSRNGRAPWFGDDTTDALVDDPARRLAEVEHRTAAALAWMKLSFALADKLKTKGVVLFMQADTWPGGQDDGFTEILQLLAELALEYGKPVLVVQGDTHVYKTDQPLLNGDVVHGITTPVPNLTRLVVQGETTGEWLKLHIDPRTPEVFSWQRMMR
jgi:hypothetical protein